MTFAKNGRAFTMIELIMVVAAIGMLAIFAIPNYTKAVSKSYEKSGSNNLLIIYAAQRVADNSGGSYMACANTTAVNTNLSLSIIPSGMNYSCTLPTASTFNCKAARTDGSFTLQVTDSNNNICCAAGSCPSVPNVGTPPC